MVTSLSKSFLSTSTCTDGSVLTGQSPEPVPAEVSLSGLGAAGRLRPSRAGGIFRVHNARGGRLEIQAGARESRLCTVEVCHAPPRAVRTPRALSASAMPARLVMLDAWMVRTIERLDKALRLGVQNENNVALLIGSRS